MSRPRSAKVAAAKAALVLRLKDRFRLPGARFLSARSIAAQFTISYQTAHRLLVELEAEGHLRRQASVGTFVPGEAEVFRKVLFVFHPRAAREGSFGAHLLERLTASCDAQGVAWTRVWARPGLKMPAGHYPVLWEASDTLEAIAAGKRFALLINDAPPAGMGGATIDAISCDDHSGGTWAAQYLGEVCGPGAHLAMLAGPPNDWRSAQRTAGFKAATGGNGRPPLIKNAAGWFYENGLAAAPAIMNAKPAGVFCANDRLAEALLRCYRDKDVVPPRIVGFDDAPVAARLGLTTVGIPWAALAETVSEIAAARLAGLRRPARHIVLPHGIVARQTA